MRVAVLYSGGKDSCAALHLARLRGLEVECLLGVAPSSAAPLMYHLPGTELLDLFPEALGERLVRVTAGEGERAELEALRGALACISGAREPGAERARGGGEGGIQALVTGALRSEYQRSRIDSVCRGLGLAHIAPLWHVDPEAHIRWLISSGFEAVFTGVAAGGLGESWLGRRLDLSALHELLELGRRHGINVDGEGGEYETLALWSPAHRRRIVLDDVERVWERDSGRLVIRRAHLE